MSEDVNLRSITHPGPPVAPRVLAEPCSARALRVTFQPGLPVLEAVAKALREHGIDGALIEIEGGSFNPLVYVMPAPSLDAEHAAWYSDMHRPEGVGLNERLVMSFGRRQGQPFIHCHGIWLHADGFRAAGHLIPHEAMFAEPVAATVYALSGAVLDQQQDAETNFPLLTPVPDGSARDGDNRAVLLRIKPNTEFSAGVEQAAQAHGITDATVHGIGSLVGCDFVDGSHMASFASELFIRDGRIADGRATLDIAIVDVDGTIFEGAITRGSNPVCVTCELLIIER
ncbi:MAG TPA: DUF296 domain-containing protein [Tianweitania sediminis]|jgi:predicted DNA-binding protein with PD1-like motif|nr:DUF296 domain-containing protein [Tianweitania sediminis]